MAVTSKKVTTGDEIKAEDHNALVDDVTALDKTAAKGPKGDPGEKGDPGANGYGTKAEFEALAARVAALEGAE